MRKKKTLQGKLPIRRTKDVAYNILLPWELKGPQITISKVTSNITPDFIQIHINTKDQLHILVKMTPHDFGSAITGLGLVPCTATIE